MASSSDGLHHGPGSSSRRPRLSRSATMLLRKEIADRESTSTAELVQAANECVTDSQQRIYAEWLDGYVGWFADKRIEQLKENELMEYSLVGALRATCDEYKDIIEMWFDSLCNKITGNQYGTGKVVKCLASALSLVDESALEDRVDSLIDIANHVLSKIDRGKTIFNEKTAKVHSLAMTVGHQALLIIQAISPDQPDLYEEEGILQKFKKLMARVDDTCNIYPLRYKAKLILQCISCMEIDQTHEEKIGKGFMKARRTMLGVLSVAKWIAKATTAHGVMELISLTCDSESFEKDLAGIMEAFTVDNINRRPWYDTVNVFSHACTLASNDPTKFELVEALLRQMEESALGNSEDLTALRFGIIEQLSLLLQNSDDHHVKTAVAAELMHLAQLCKSQACWGSSPEIFDTLLATFPFVHQVQDAEEAFATTMEVIQQNELMKVAIVKWLENSTLANKLAASVEENKTPSTSETLFFKVRNGLGWMQKYEMIKEMRSDVKKHYQSSAFTSAPTLFENDPAKNVVNLEHELVVLDEVRGNDRPLRDSALPQAIRGIEIEQLFDDIKGMSDQANKEVRRLLIIGNPGTGKSVLGRKIAHLWAVGKWGAEFEAVYLVPVRDVNKTNYNNSGTRTAKNLPTAISNICFPPTTADSAFETIRDCVAEDLLRNSTLVILDGLDESETACAEVIQQAKDDGIEHELLILSRPGGLQGERHLVDREVECKGLNDEHIERYIKDDVNSDSVVSLIESLKQNSQLWDTAHIPVHLVALCALFKSGEEECKNLTDLSILTLYRKIADHILDRYLESHPEVDVRRSDVFSAVEGIALEAMKTDRIYVDRELLDRHTETRKMQSMVKGSGLLFLKSTGCQYHFIHLTFQECFGGIALANLLLSKEDAQREQTKQFLAENKYRGSYLTMFKFMSMSLAKQGGLLAIENMFEVLDTPPIAVVIIQSHLILKMTLLESALSICGKVESRERSLKRIGTVLDTLDRICEIDGHEDDLAFIVWKYLVQIPRVRKTVKNYTGPENLDEFLEPLVKDESVLRFLAFKQNSRLFKERPDTLKRFMPLLFQIESSEFHHSYDCQVVLDVLPKFPDYTDKLMKKFISAMKSRDWSKWSENPCSLIEEALKAAPDYAVQLTELRDQLKDKTFGYPVMASNLKEYVMGRLDPVAGVHYSKIYDCFARDEDFTLTVGPAGDGRTRVVIYEYSSKEELEASTEKVKSVLTDILPTSFLFQYKSPLVDLPEYKLHEEFHDFLK